MIKNQIMYNKQHISRSGTTELENIGANQNKRQKKFEYVGVVDLSETDSLCFF